MSEKRLRIVPPLSKRDPAYWRQRLFKNAYAYKGRHREVTSWSVKIQFSGKRKSFTLTSLSPEQAANEACQIYQAILNHGWKAVMRRPTATTLPLHPPPGPTLSYVLRDAHYWQRRLIHRKYPEPADSQPNHQFSIRIEHARRSQYFPLGTSDENEAASRATQIYHTVVEQGWAKADSGYPRELSLALRWQDNPLAWTYTTIHTRHHRASPKPLVGEPGRAQEQSVVFIEPDPGIRFALAACANSQKGFRCDATFSDAAEALREIPRRRVDLAFANHDLPSGGVPGLEELSRVRPTLTVLSYSVFEDADELFKSTPGGAVVYMLKRTSPARIFEPIGELAAPATREQIASHVRSYFQHLSALLPAGPPPWKLAKLTPREHEILVFLSKGDSVKEIADKLGISNWTVHGHVKSIFEKLKVHSRTEAVIKYLQK